jgi:hypothetical protein
MDVYAHLLCALLYCVYCVLVTIPRVDIIMGKIAIVATSVLFTVGLNSIPFVKGIGIFPVL